MALIERQYLGEGYIHVFINEVTGDVLNIPCSKEEYEALGQPNPTNPSMTGYRWSHSSGGTAKVDTPDTTLGIGEYCVIGEKVLINEEGKDTDFVSIEELTTKLALEEM